MKKPAAVDKRTFLRQASLAKAEAVLVEYLRMKVEERDWHAVADAAMDLRELAIRIQLMR